MEQIMNYVKPELVVVAIVLYFIGMWLKKAETVTDKYIPIILGSALYLTWTRYDGIYPASSHGAVTRDSFLVILCAGSGT